MPALKPTSLTGTLTWLGHVPDREASLASSPLEQTDLTWEGIAGEAHGGLNRPSCSRVTALYKRGTDIRNTRQLCLLSAEELAEIAAEMGLARLDPSWLGASLVVEGIADFTHLPPSSRLQAPSGATLVIDMENRPCNLPVPYIQTEDPEIAKRFRRAAQGRRGVTAWVECPGLLSLGDRLSLFIPDQRAWKGVGEHLSGGGN